MPGAAERLAEFEMAQRGEHAALSRHPAVPRQPGSMAQQIAQARLLARDGIAQPKLLQYRAHRHVPVEPALVDQQCESRRGERYCDRADREHVSRATGAPASMSR
jgi:hypothetical protein